MLYKFTLLLLVHQALCLLKLDGNDEIAQVQENAGKLLRYIDRAHVIQL